jgi:hypothetical protein
MENVVNTYEEAKQFFLDSCQRHNLGEVILFHNQRNTVAKLLHEVATECGRTLIDKDLTTLNVNELHFYKTEGLSIPGWLKEVMERKNPHGYIIYLREFHLASDKVQDDVMNILIKKAVEGITFPDNTLIILGARQEDEAAESLSHTHVLKFYREQTVPAESTASTL